MHYKEKELACQSNPKLTPEQKNKAGLKVNSMRLIHPYALHGPSTGETRNILRAYVKGKAWGAAGTQNSLSSLTGSHRATSLSVAYFGNLPTPKLSQILMSTRAEIESGTRNWDCLCPPREDLRFFDTEGKHPRFWGSLHFQFGTPRKLSLISGEIQALPQLCSARNLFPEPIRY